MVQVDGQPCVLEILDTAGTEQFACELQFVFICVCFSEASTVSAMRDLYIKNGQGFLVVYSISNQQSFHDIRTMRDQIVRVKVLLLLHIYIPPAIQLILLNSRVPTKCQSSSSATNAISCTNGKCGQRKGLRWRSSGLARLPSAARRTPTTSTPCSPKSCGRSTMCRMPGQNNEEGAARLCRQLVRLGRDWACTLVEGS